MTKTRRLGIHIRNNECPARFPWTVRLLGSRLTRNTARENIPGPRKDFPWVLRANPDVDLR